MRHLYSGKVRDVYELGPSTLLLVTSDRISAFDVVMAEPVPDKGRVLTALSVFWARRLSNVAPTHLVSTDLPATEELRAAGVDPGYALGRSMLVRRAQMLPLECIVRGYLSGSAWAEYSRAGTVHGQAMPAGLQQSDQLPEPVFTPSTKATSGHDQNISYDQAVGLVGDKMAARAREISLEAYRVGADWARQRGIIIADTKFELGLVDNELTICDEIMTPDSSRFWPAASWRPGGPQPSFDKQPLRDWLEGTGWDKSPPPPSLPAHVVEATRARYVEAYERLTGLRFADWPAVGGKAER
ncbi:MAG: phosphoribosylaminoimidazolesuccinocarboxamide synthase [Acidimicrobiales bacterium]